MYLWTSRNFDWNIMDGWSLCLWVVWGCMETKEQEKDQEEIKGRVNGVIMN